MASQFFGFNPPFFGGNNKVMSPQEGVRLIKNDLIQLILTFPTERIFRPDFGTVVRGKLFDQNTPVDINEVRTSIIEAIQEFEPRVDLADVIVETDDVSMTIQVLGTFNVGSDGGEAISENSLLVELNLDRAPTNG